MPLEESGLAPKEIWCNESQERYVVALAPESLPLFEALCERERCPYAVVGVRRATTAGWCSATGRDDRDDEDRAIDMPMDVLLGKPPEDARATSRASARDGGSLDLTGVDLQRGRVRRAAPPDGRLASASSSPSATAPSAG